MAIKKQKRSMQELATAGGEKSQNGGGQKNKFEQKVKKLKLDKQSEPSPKLPGSPVKKVKPEKQFEPMAKPVGSPVKKVTESKGEATSSKEAKKAAKLLKKNENRKEARKEQGQFKAEKINFSADELRQKIKVITARSDLTKSAKRRLGVLKKKLSILEGTSTPHVPQAPKNPGLVKFEKKNKVETEKKANGGPQISLKKSLPNQPLANPSGQIKSGKNKVQKGADKKKAIAEPKPEESDDDDDDDDEEEEAEEEEEEESDEEMDQSEGGTPKASDEEDDDDDDEDDEEEEDEEEEEEEEEVAKDTKPVLPVKKNKKEMKTEAPAKKQAGPEAAGEGGKKKRFVLFVGNLSFQATENDIKNHFLTKVGAVESVRIPMKPGSKSPRGFAYVELTNEIDYQKGLALHNTSINGRRINVEYTQGGSKTVGNRSEVVSKNKKLHAMRKGGMFAGKRDDRNDRRKRQQKQT